jgi:hypothetical protein
MASTEQRVVVLIQENKTTDFYFGGLAAWGAEVAPGPFTSTPPDFDQPHDRNAWVHYRMGDYAPVDIRLDTDAVIPLYAYLAKQFVFCDHHVGLGSNSTPGHMLAVCGQAATLRNPSGNPTWDLPTIFKHAERAGVSWAAYAADGNYPTKFFTELEGSPNLFESKQFAAVAAAGNLPQLTFLWSPDGLDEHPPLTSDPQYIANGTDYVWQNIDAVVAAGQWATTTFILTWDDWGGYADHVVTPSAETVPDALHPGGFQVIAGSRIPLLMFGGQVDQGIDSRWCSLASIPKTVIDLFGLPPLGVPRVDQAPSLAGHVDAARSRPEPPRHGTAIVQPPAPSPPRKPKPPGAWPGALDQPMPPLVANGGKTIKVPTDGTVKRTPPKPPPQT